MKAKELLREQTSVDESQSRKELDLNSESVDMTKYEILEDSPFVLVEGADGWFIVIGEHIVSEKRFATKEMGMRYVDSKPWDLIIGGAHVYIMILEKLVKEKEQLKK